MTDLKTRFCPSPTGMMHLGNLRTALFNKLLAMAKRGTFLLRIEDTDVERSDERYSQLLMTDLRWLSLEWNEGVDHGGDLGPYRQSNRQTIYDDYYERLEEMGMAYPCFCSEEELQLARKLQRAQGKPPRYQGTCRNLSEAQVAEKIAKGLEPTLRFRVDQGATVEFDDLVRGVQKFQTDDIGDFIIRRANGTSPFMFCNAIDDALMGVTHVLRGEDHLTNTPRQVMILNSLGLSVPTYAHISLIIGPDGSPLSKRHGSKSVKELRQQGFLPAAIINYLARLGHYYGHDKLLSLTELASEFKVENLQKSPAKFNPEQLFYWQKEAVHTLDETGFWIWVSEESKHKVPENKRSLFVETVKPNVQFPVEVNRWIDILFNQDFELVLDQCNMLQDVDAAYFKTAIEAVKQHGHEFKPIMEALKSNLKLKGKALYQPMRIALTGDAHGPELAKIMQLLGVDGIKKRLEQCINGVNQAKKV